MLQNDTIMLLSIRTSRRLLLVIIVGYLVVGVSFAYFTPDWQVPDEPAHYNYIRFVAEERRLPILQMGDYPHDYLETMKTRRFPSNMSIDPLRYESHQPPLYYMLAAIVFRLSTGSLFALRGLSVLLGAGLLIVVWALFRTVSPQRPDLGLGTTAFVAFLPMHVAMTSSVNNDVLAELMLVSSVLSLVQYYRIKRFCTLKAVGVGLLTGLGLITKITTYIVVPLILATIYLMPRNEVCLGDCQSHSIWQRKIRDSVLILGVAGLVLLPWLLRNYLVYGGFDLLGMIRHNQIVVGQPQTVDWLAQRGMEDLVRSFIQTTFQSFWGQFGWMGILLDDRLYLLLKLLSGLAALGVLLTFLRYVWPIGQRAAVRFVTLERVMLKLAGLWFLLSFIAYLGYNFRFVQHQGRYLFPALVPLGLAFVIGLAEILSRHRALLVAGICLSGGVLLITKSLIVGEFDKWIMASIGGLGIALLLRRHLPLRWDNGMRSLPYVGLFILDYICLFGFIVPGLR